MNRRHDRAEGRVAFPQIWTCATTTPILRSTEMSEHRRYHRVRPTGSGKTGTIFVNLKDRATVCSIIDVSAGGACIDVHGVDAIPRKFILNFGGVKKSCRLVWQKGRRIGVSF
jgi:hypothetical protein